MRRMRRGAAADAARCDPGRGAGRGPDRRASPARRLASSLLERALAFWSWLARPQVAAGFASVMAATLVGHALVGPADRRDDAAAAGVAAGRGTARARSEAPPATGSDRRQRRHAGRRPPNPARATPRRQRRKIASPRAAEDAAALETARRQQQHATAGDTRRHRRARTCGDRGEAAARSEAAKAERKDDRKRRGADAVPGRAITAAVDRGRRRTPFPAALAAPDDIAPRRACAVPARAAPHGGTRSSAGVIAARSRCRSRARARRAAEPLRRTEEGRKRREGTQPRPRPGRPRRHAATHAARRRARRRRARQRRGERRRPKRRR